ncbi:hypothetical protein JYU14_01705, partial [Simkania negevensis]|nr:hypothetical protein [Simkania negevensis]
FLSEAVYRKAVDSAVHGQSLKSRALYVASLLAHLTVVTLEVSLGILAWLVSLPASWLKEGRAFRKFSEDSFSLSFQALVRTLSSLVGIFMPPSSVEPHPPVEPTDIREIKDENIQFDDVTRGIRELVRTCTTTSSSEIHKCLGKVFVMSNELHLTESRDRLEREVVEGKNCHIGCAGWYNFDIICSRKSTYGMIFDYDSQNKVFIDLTLEVLMLSSDREAFVETMNELIQSKEKNIRYDDNFDGYSSLEARIRGELNREGSWLSTNENFMHMKSLAENGKVIAETVNLARSNVLQVLSDFLREKELRVDSVYLSNIRVFLSEEDKKSFVTNLGHVVMDDTLVVNCPEFTAQQAGNKCWAECNLRQHVCLGKELSKNGNGYFKYEEAGQG